MTQNLTAIVEMLGRDPNGLRESCEEFCREQLLGEPLTADEATREKIVIRLLNDFLKTIDPRTTGAGALAVSVVVR